MTANAACCTLPVPPGLAVATDRMPSNNFVQVVGAQQPDVVMVQEVLERHVKQIAEALGLEHYVFAPMHHPFEPAGVSNRMGLCVFSRWPLTPVEPFRYGGFADDNPGLWSNWQDWHLRGERLSCVFQEVSVALPGGKPLRLGNTHFTWSPRGEFTPVQRAALERLLLHVNTRGDIVWGGDMNLPRGLSEGWDWIRWYWRDNIPSQYTTSLDPRHHLAVQKYGIERMVDGLWTRRDSRYSIGGVEMHGDASDHLVVSATVEVAI